MVEAFFEKRSSTLHLLRADLAPPLPRLLSPHSLIHPCILLTEPTSHSASILIHCIRSLAFHPISFSPPLLLCSCPLSSFLPRTLFSLLIHPSPTSPSSSSLLYPPPPLPPSSIPPRLCRIDTFPLSFLSSSFCSVGSFCSLSLPLCLARSKAMSVSVCTSPGRERGSGGEGGGGESAAS